MRRLDPIDVAFWVLLIMALRHNAYTWFPPELRGIVSKALGGAATLGLLVLLLAVWRELRAQWADRLPLLAAAVWYMAEEAQVFGCSVLYAISPWPVQVGEPICSALVGVRLEHVGLFVTAWTGAKLWEWRRNRG